MYIILAVIISMVTFSSSALADNPSYIYPDSGIKRLIKVDEIYYRGANPDEASIKFLSDLGVKSMIDLRLINKKKLNKLQKISQPYGITVYSIPLHPSKAPDKEEIDLFFKIIENPENQPVFVHCTHGQDRTGIMSALYRVNKYNWKYDQAYEEMLFVGYHPRLYPRLKKFLKEYIEQKNNQTQTNNESYKTNE